MKKNPSGFELENPVQQPNQLCYMAIPCKHCGFLALYSTSHESCNFPVLLGQGPFGRCDLVLIIGSALVVYNLLPSPPLCSLTAAYRHDPVASEKCRANVEGGSTEVIGTLSKRGWQHQCRKARKIFLCNPCIL